MRKKTNPGHAKFLKCIEKENPTYDKDKARALVIERMPKFLHVSEEGFKKEEARHVRKMKNLKRLVAILEMRYEEKMTLQKIAEKYGITRQRAQQIISKSMTL